MSSVRLRFRSLNPGDVVLGIEILSGMQGGQYSIRHACGHIRTITPDGLQYRFRVGADHGLCMACLWEERTGTRPAWPKGDAFASCAECGKAHHQWRTGR